MNKGSNLDCNKSQASAYDFIHQTDLCSCVFLACVCVFEGWSSVSSRETDTEALF